jgi:hypothetical protein
MEERRSGHMGMVYFTTCNMEWFLDKKTRTTNNGYCNCKHMEEDKTRE